jgi:hypothetical protein
VFRRNLIIPAYGSRNIEMKLRETLAWMMSASH